MKIDTYVSNAPAVVSKDALIEELENVQASIEQTATTEYVAAAGLFRGDKFKNERLKSMSSTFSRIYGNTGNDGMIGTIAKGLDTINDNLNKIRVIIDAEVPMEIAAGAITYKNATIMQFIEYSALSVEYARRMLNLVYVLESKTDESEEGESLRQAEDDFLRDNFMTFCDAFRIVTTETNKLAKVLDDLPEVAVNADSFNSIRGQGGIAKVDPLKFGFIAPRNNWLFKIRMIWVERQANKFKAAKLEKQQLELRRMRYIRAKDGKNDAALDAKIKSVEMQLSNVQYFIAQQEKKYGK